MKRVMYVVLALFLIGLVYAGPGGNNYGCKGDSDVMFKLTSETNAHVSEYSDSNADVPICYSNFFGGLFSGQSVHKCTGKNALFYLAQHTNSHVSVKGDKVYNVRVCYGDLDCTARTPDCKKDETEILDLISNTNSHASFPGRMNDYKIKICCSSKQSKNFRSWRDKGGKVVNEVRVGETVYAFYPGYGGNPDDTFDVYAREGSNKRVIFKDVKGKKMKFQGIEGWGWEWKVSGADFMKKTGEYGKFIFEINEKESNQMRVTFCGDNIMQAGYEECDQGEKNGVVCVPRGGNRFCQYCNKECGYSSGGAAFCGDGVVENETNGYPGFHENCDWGEKNSKTCKPEAGKTKCNYCDSEVCKLYTIDYSKNLFWSDLGGNRILNALPETSILMNLIKGSCSNIQKKFSIYDKDPGRDTPIKENIESKECASNTYKAQWNIPSLEDLAEKTTNSRNDFSDLKDFIFKVGGEPGESDKLEINYVRLNPKIKISGLSVKCGDVIKKDETKDISFQIDGPHGLKGEIRVDGAKVGDINGPGKVSVTYKFDKVGSHQIVIYLNDVKRKRVLSYFVNVLVYDSQNGQSGEKYVAACIKEPNVLLGSENPMGYVFFDASNSKAIDGKGNPIDFSKLEFDWEFSDGIKYSMKGSDKSAYNFYKFFDISGDNWAKLTVKVT